MDTIAKINWIDIFAVIIIARTSYVALKDGLSHEIFPFIGTIFTAAISVRYYHELAVFAKGIAGLSEQFMDMAAFLLLAVVIAILFRLARFLVDALMKVTWHPFVEKFGGLVVGLLRGAVVVSIVLTALSLSGLPYLKKSITERSLSGPYFLNLAPDISGKLAWILPAAVKK